MGRNDQDKYFLPSTHTGQIKADDCCINLTKREFLIQVDDCTEYRSWVRECNLLADLDDDKIPSLPYFTCDAGQTMCTIVPESDFKWPEAKRQIPLLHDALFNAMNADLSTDCGSPTDDDGCLQDSLGWNAFFDDEIPSCANATGHCDSWEKDLKRCCPVSCGTGALTKANCDALGGRGICTYPNDAQPVPCGEYTHTHRHTRTSLPGSCWLFI